MFVLVICAVLFVFISQDTGEIVLLGEIILFCVMIVRLIPSFNRLNHFINFHLFSMRGAFYLFFHSIYFQFLLKEQSPKGY